MAALLTYRSRISFEERFGRNTPDPSRQQAINDNLGPANPSNEHWAVHNDGHRSTGHRSSRPSRAASINGVTPPRTPEADGASAGANGNSTQFTDPQFNGITTFDAPTPPTPVSERRRATTYFSAQSYLRYQGNKFVRRFDSNCYIAITRKLDTHDVSRPLDNDRHRVAEGSPDSVAEALAQIQQPTLVLGIESDGLFTYAEQKEIKAGIPDCRFKTIVSPEGHDAFLLEFQQVNKYILEFFREVLPEFVQQPSTSKQDKVNGVDPEDDNKVGVVAKTSLLGETEVGDITAW